MIGACRETLCVGRRRTQMQTHQNGGLTENIALLTEREKGDTNNSMKLNWEY